MTGIAGPPTQRRASRRVVRSGTPVPRAAALLCALVTTLVAAPVFVAPAAAHTELVSASPADGSTVRTAPTRVTLRFNGLLRAPSAVVVTGPDGARVSLGEATVSRTAVSVRVRLGDGGRHTVAYRVVSQDGHPVTGRTRFAFRPPAEASQAPEATSSPEATPGSAAGSAAGSTGSPSAGSSPASQSSGAASQSEHHDGTHDEEPATGLSGSATGWTVGGGLVVLSSALLLWRRRGDSAGNGTGGDPE